MFRAHRSDHQERQIVSIQPLVAVTLCRWPCRVQVGISLPTCTRHGHWQLPEVVLTQFVIPDDEQDVLERCRVKVILQQAEVAQGVPDRLRSRIFLTFGTTRVVGRQPNAPVAFTPREIPGTFRGWVDLKAHGSVGENHGKKSPVTPPGIDPGTVRLVAQCLNHYATPGPAWNM